MPKIAVNDINIYYEIQGNGSQLLFIGGIGSDLRNRPSIFDSPLTENFTVLAYDQRGFGQTSKPDKPYSMKGYAEDAAGLLDAIGWGQCLVMGVSFGGMVAQEMAIRFPKKITRLALLCTSSGGEGGASYPLHELSDLTIEERARKELEMANLNWDDEWREKNQDLYNSIFEKRISQMQFVENNPELSMGFRRQLEARKQHDTYDRLPNINIPTGIFGGKYDGITLPENLQNLQRQIPNSIFEMFEGGHLFRIQDPRAFPRIIAFLKG